MIVFVMRIVQTIRRRRTIGCTIKSLRPSNRTCPNPPSSIGAGDPSESSMPAAVLPSSLADSFDDDVFSGEHSVLEFPVFGRPETVCVDVSGCCYTRQSRVRSTLMCRGVLTEDDTSDVAADHRRLSSWRRTIVDVEPRRQGLMAFGGSDVDRSALFRGLVATRKSTSSRRSLVAAGTALQIYASQASRAPAGSKYGAGRFDDGERPRSSCSWRLSLTSLLRGVVRTRSSVDLWATTTVQHQQAGAGGGAVASGAHHAPIKFRRANSLPRSLKSMKRHSNSDTARFARRTICTGRRECLQTGYKFADSPLHPSLVAKSSTSVAEIRAGMSLLPGGR